MFKVINKNPFTLLEMMVAITLFSFMTVVMLGVFDGTQKNVKENINREEISKKALSILSEIQESIHQAAEIYNHVPASSSDDSEANLFYSRVEWTNIPLRMGSDLGNPDFHNRLPDITGQTANLAAWIADNESDDYAARFHTNDIIYSLPPVNGPGIPSGSRGYAGNVFLIAKHLVPIEIVISKDDVSIDTAKDNSDSHLYKQTRLFGNQLIVEDPAENDDKANAGERMYSIDCVRFDLYYISSDTDGSWYNVPSTTNESLVRSGSLRLVKAESVVFAVHSKLKTLKTNLDAYYAQDNDENPDDFPLILAALKDSEGFYFDSAVQRIERLPIVYTIDYLDSSAGPEMYELDDGGSNGFSSAEVTDLIKFESNRSRIFLDDNGVERGATVTIGNNTKWATGETIDFNSKRHIPWFAQQPEILGSGASDLFPSGFEITGSGSGDKQRIGMRLCLWLRTTSRVSAYSHFMIGARAQ